MSFDALLNHDLVVRRMAAGGTADEWGQPVSGPVTVATVRGHVEPRSAREMALASQAGVQVGDHVGFLRPLAGIGTDCWVEVAGARFDVLGVRDAAGRGHHLELDLRRVGP